MKMRKILIIILGTLSLLIIGGGVAYAADPQATESALSRISSVFVTNWPENQNVTGSVGINNFPATQNVNVTNSSPIPVSVSNSSSSNNFEYKNLYIWSNTPYLQEYTDQQLNDLGSQGWKLVGHSARETNYIGVWIYDYVFERPIVQ